MADIEEKFASLIQQRETILALAEGSTRLLYGKEGAARRWKTMAISQLTLEEQAVLYTLSPSEVSTLFPRMSRGMWTFSPPDVLVANPVPVEWQIMSTALAQFGVLALIADKVPVPLGVATTLAIICSGELWAEARAHVGASRASDMITYCARNCARVATGQLDSRVAECIGRVRAMFAVAPSAPRGELAWIKMTDMDASATRGLCVTHAGLAARGAICEPIGARMRVTLPFPLFEYNLRVAIATGMCIAPFEPGHFDPANSCFPSRATWLRYALTYTRVITDPDAAWAEYAARTHIRAVYDYVHRRVGWCAATLLPWLARARIPRTALSGHADAYTRLCDLSPSVRATDQIDAIAALSDMMAAKPTAQQFSDIYGMFAAACSRSGCDKTEEYIPVPGHVLSEEIALPRYVDATMWACAHAWPADVWSPVAVNGLWSVV
jgi:hypothetical protein